MCLSVFFFTNQVTTRVELNSTRAIVVYCAISYDFTREVLVDCEQATTEFEKWSRIAS